MPKLSRCSRRLGPPAQHAAIARHSCKVGLRPCLLQATSRQRPPCPSRQRCAGLSARPCRSKLFLSHSPPPPPPPPPPPAIANVSGDPSLVVYRGPGQGATRDARSRDTNLPLSPEHLAKLIAGILRVPCTVGSRPQPRLFATVQVGEPQKGLKPCRAFTIRVWV